MTFLDTKPWLWLALLLALVVVVDASVDEAEALLDPAKVVRLEDQGHALLPEGRALALDVHVEDRERFPLRLTLDDLPLVGPVRGAKEAPFVLRHAHVDELVREVLAERGAEVAALAAGSSPSKSPRRNKPTLSFG